MRVEIPQLLWHGNTTLEIDLPGEWDVEICPMHGAGWPPLTVEQMSAAVNDPIESLPIRDLAGGKKSAVIVFDDMTRPTRAYELAPIVLNQLEKAGLSRENISFVCALGAHGALTPREFKKKLGPEIVENFRVFNHNPYENCVHVGTTSFGTPVMINREVMEADVKIGIGCVTAHAQTGFSGGGKLLVPGVSHIDTISHLHNDVQSRAPETTGPASHENNIMRRNIDEAASMAGMDFKVEVIVNDRGAATAVCAGDMKASHARAVKLAGRACETSPRPENKDLVIANAFAKANEMTVAVRTGAMALSGFRGTLVVIAASPEGQVVHYLLGRFGRNYGGRGHPVSTVAAGLELIIMAPYFDKTFADWFSNPGAVTWTRSWESTLEILKERFPENARAAVLPNATMQY